MIFRIALAALILIGAAGSSFSQISFTFSDLRLAHGVTLEKGMGGDGTEIDVGEAGANRSWDFRNLETIG